MNWVKYTQLNKLGVSTSLPNLLPKFFGLSLLILVCSVELRPLIKARKEKIEIVSDWTRSVDQSKTEALARNFQRVDKLLLPAQDWLRD